MKKCILLVSVYIYAFSFSVIAQDHYVPDLTCCEITEEILDLKVETARLNITAQLALHENNYYLYYLDQFNDFVQFLIAPNEDRFYRLNDKFDAYREIMDDQDTDSPYYLYVLSSMQLQLSLSRLKSGQTFSGARMGWKSYRNMEQNIKRFPDFYGNKKLRGLFNVMLNNMPPFLRSVAAIFGVKAGKESTFDLLSSYKEEINDKKGLSTEASIFIALSLLLDKKTEQAYNYISNLEQKHYAVFLVNYFRGNLAYQNGDNEMALQVLHDLDIDDTEINFYPYYFIYGKALMNRLDQEANLRPTARA